MADPRVRFVLNPRAGGAAASRRLPALVDAMQRVDLPFEIARTTGPGDATRIARASFDDGIDLLAVVGGDGTLNETIQAFVDARGDPRPGPDLAVIPIGTGGDFKRTLGLSGDLHEAVGRLRHGTVRPFDLASMQLESHDGGSVVRAFLNITSFGVGGVTDQLVNATPKWLGGKASFFIGSARAMIHYRNQPVRVRVDDALFVDGPVFNVAMANGRYFGGGMMVAPEADPSDGLLDVVSLGDLTRAEALSLSGKIYQGLHLSAPKVTSIRGARIEAEPHHQGQDVLLDMDGETPGKLPVSVRILPGALRVRT